MPIGSWKEERGRFAHRSEVHCWILTSPLCCIGVLRKHIYSNIIDKVSTTSHLTKVDRYFIIRWKEIRLCAQYQKSLSGLKWKSEAGVHLCIAKLDFTGGPHKCIFSQLDNICAFSSTENNFQEIRLLFFMVSTWNTTSLTVSNLRQH